MRISVICKLGVLVTTLVIVQFHTGLAQVEENETVRVPTDLLQASVTVVDKSGRFVDGLKREQFQLRIEGAVRPISFLERVSAGTVDERERLSKIGVDEIARRLDRSSDASVRGRTIVFFIDDLHLSLDSLKRTRESLLYFIDHKLGSKDQVAIVSASGQIGFLQQFTSNRSVLRAAAARLLQRMENVLDTEQPTMSEYMAIKISERDRDAFSYYIGRCLTENRNYTPQKCTLVIRDRAREIIRRGSTVTDRTFSALNSTMQSAARMPGRKLVLLVSDGFFLNPREGSAYSAFENVIDTARRTGTWIYTIDARGLISGQADATVNLVDANGILDRAAIGEIGRSQDGMNALAADTGGRATRNSNSILNWVRTTLDETSNYYLVAWHAEPDEVDAKFKKIELSIPERADLIVRQPRGYLTAAALKKPVKGSPEKSRVSTQANALGATKSESTAASSARLPVLLSLKYLDVPDIGGVVTSSIQIAASEGDTPAKTATIDVAGIVFNDQGKQVADFTTGLKMEGTNVGASQNLIYNNRTRLAPGIYQIKVAAKEQGTGRAGVAAEWIQVPDISRGELALGSLFLDFKQVTSANKFDVAQVQFSVDHLFRKPLDVSFLSFVYNATTGPDGKVSLTMRVDVLDVRENVVMSSPTQNIPASNLSDLKRIPIAGEIRQSQLPSGTCVLRVTVNDVVSGRTAVETTAFTVR